MPEDAPTTLQKALTINLDPRKYGTIAEIGAGQEVARFFFQAGAAAGTIAKAMSAYDMQFSDAIYGETSSGRYVTEDRLDRMLEKEFTLILERITESRPTHSTFFAFADTVAAKSYLSKHESHGWMGVRLQLYPEAPPSEIKLHVRMQDASNPQQQEALGILGVNLIYGAYTHYREPYRLIDSLLENLTTERIEIDSLSLSGPFFDELDERLVGLYLVQRGLTDAVLFAASGEQILAADAFRKKHVLVTRGQFRPITHVTADMLACGKRRFVAEPNVDSDALLVLAELTMADLNASGSIDANDFLARIDCLALIGIDVLISNYVRYSTLRQYLQRYATKEIGIVVGIKNVLDIFDEQYYRDMEGGLLEAVGKLFTGHTRLYVYPQTDPATGAVITADTLKLSVHLQGLYQHLRLNEFIEPLEGFDQSTLDIQAPEVLAALQRGAGDWRAAVPEAVADRIVERRLFGFAST